MADKKAEEEDATPWRTPGSTGAPLSGTAPKKYSDAEIETAVKMKPAAAPSAAEASGEPKQSDYPDVITYNIARRKWAQKQTTPEAMNKGLTVKRVSGK